VRDRRGDDGRRQPPRGGPIIITVIRRGAPHSDAPSFRPSLQPVRETPVFARARRPGMTGIGQVDRPTRIGRTAAMISRYSVSGRKMRAIWQAMTWPTMSRCPTGTTPPERN
jgi:hypothetical protein